MQCNCCFRIIAVLMLQCNIQFHAVVFKHDHMKTWVALRCIGHVVGIWSDYCDPVAWAEWKSQKVAASRSIDFSIVVVHLKELQSELTSRTENIALMLSIPVGQRWIDEGSLLFMVELRPDQMSKLLIVAQITLCLHRVIIMYEKGWSVLMFIIMISNRSS